METRKLTPAERDRLASQHGVTDLALTCEGDRGYGPCGTYLDWPAGVCEVGHEIEIEQSKTEPIACKVCDENPGHRSIHGGEVHHGCQFCWC